MASPEGSTGPDPASALDPASAARRVLDVVDSIPAGLVLTYGDVAELADLRSPRQVGQVLRRYGHEVPWFRVVRSNGEPASQDPREHRARLLDDGVPLRDGRVDMRRARWGAGSGAAKAGR